MHSSCDGYRSALAYSSSRAPLTASRPDSARLTYPWETAVSPASDDMAAATSTCALSLILHASTQDRRDTLPHAKGDAKQHASKYSSPRYLPVAEGLPSML